MIDIATVADEELSQTLRLLKGEFIKRNWNVHIPYLGSPHCFIDRKDGSAQMHIFSATPPTTTYAAASLANDKFGTYELLKSVGIPQPESFVAGERSDFKDVIAFMQSHGRVVVKPTDGGHGKGITVNVDTPEKLTAAIEEARAARKNIDAAIVQQQYSHDTILDIRILCIDYEFVAATWRVPARVFGDGQHTVLELIEIENATERRGRAYYTELATIDLVKAEQYLGDNARRVPEVDEMVFVLGIANYGAGGETVDITDELPDWLKEVAVKASRASALPVSGVDFMLAKIPTKQSTQEELDAMLIEINKCPLLAMHDMPTSGSPRGAVARYVEYLANLKI